MSDPSSVLGSRVIAATVAAFGEQYASVDPMVRRSEHADYQANLAMGLGRTLRRAPRDVAGALIPHLALDGVCERIEISGPGFLNFTLSADFIAREVGVMSAAPRAGVAPLASPERVVIDYSAPNVAKEMHVGHLRTSVIGDALARTLSFLGCDVVRQNHLGDWGTPFGMLIEHMIDLGEGASQRLSTVSLNEFYREARRKFEADVAFAERSRLRVVALQSGDAPTLASWRTLVATSMVHFRAVYDLLGVQLQDSDVRAESSYNAQLPEVAAELEKLGLARLSDGALCVFPGGFTGRNGEPLPLIVRKSDGGYGYAATDLAAIRHRAITLGASRLIYVVGAPQSQHFEMVFAVARAAGWLASGARAEHVAFGSVLGPDGKMFRTRAGDSVRLLDLLTEAVARAETVVADRSPDLDEATRRDVSRAVGVGAVKYADLSNDRNGDYAFEWDRMLATDGNTGPYLQYAHARACSIQERVGDVPAAATAIHLSDPAERDLALFLLQFGSAVDAVARELKPHVLCTYLFGLATRFMAFYERCPVLRAQTAELRASRVVLCGVTARTLSLGLSLLGIDAPRRM